MAKWHKTDEQKLISACVHYCNLIEGSNICGGCFRTTDEIQAWRYLDVDARKVILDKSEVRRSHCQNQIEC
ncbi:DUF1289 domain-containing protein [Microbulbifer pacificus]|uniref:DUF1289 domain-containing protein n=1 Tax=Microbulbifer pacificus TaxID=407164 RepID=UPI00384BCF90